jgi:DNA-binding HxlR family transcriptional regulator
MPYPRWSGTTRFSKTSTNSARRPGVTRYVRTSTIMRRTKLRELVHDGIVARRPTGEAPAPVEYSLTAYGRTVLPLVEEVRAWGRAHLARATPESPA